MPSQDSEWTASGVTRRRLLTLDRPNQPVATVVELAPVGAVNIETAEYFREMGEELLAQGATRFLVDLEQVERIDSTGLGVLLRLYREAKARGGGVWFYNITPAIRTIFSLTNLDKVISVDASRAAALARAQEA